jgi:hypothetical protein
MGNKFGRWLMNLFIQFFLEPFNWVVLATVILSFLVEHFNQLNRRESVRARSGSSASHHP